MIFSLVLIGLLASAATSALGQRAKVQVKPIEFLPGNTYEYELSQKLLSGIPHLANQYAGFQIKAKLRFTSVNEGLVVMKLDNIQVGNFNNPVSNYYRDNSDAVLNWNDEYQRELSKPVRFVHENGKIHDFEVEASDPVWSVNTKKAVLSMFNLNLHPERVLRQEEGVLEHTESAEDLRYYGVYENTVAGICETTYEINEEPSRFDLDPASAQVLNVTKVRNFKNCLTEPTMVKDNSDARGCVTQCRKMKSFAAVRGYIPVPDELSEPYSAGCPCKMEPESSPVEQYNYVKYNLTLEGQSPVIESILSEGKVVYTTFGDKIMVITHQNVTLKQIVGSRTFSVQPPQNPTRHSELAFRIPEPTHKIDEDSSSSYARASAFGPQDIPYYKIFDSTSTQELKRNLKNLMETVADQIASTEISDAKSAPEKIIQIVNTLATMKPEELEEAYKVNAQPGKSVDASERQQVARKIFLDAIPLSGTNVAAKFIKQLIHSNQVTPFEAKQMVEAIPQNMFLADVKTMDDYLELCASPNVYRHRHLFASTCLTFAKLVRQGCVKAPMMPGDLPDKHDVPHDKRYDSKTRNILLASYPRPQPPPKPAPRPPSYPAQSKDEVPALRTHRISRRDVAMPWEDLFTQEVCEEQHIEKYVEAIGQLMEKANEFHEKLILLEALAHMSVPQALKYLEPYVSGRVEKSQCPGYETEEHEDIDEECNFVRNTAIYALSHISEYYPKQVLPLLLPVYRNPNEPYEVRIAAFTILLLADPDTQTLTSIASELHRETNKQVKSFVASAFKTFGNFSAPCTAKLAQSAKLAHDMTPEEAKNLGLKYSKMAGKGVYDYKRNYGLWSISEWVSNNISSVPRAGYIQVGRSDGPISDHLLELGFTAKGLERMIKRIAEPNGLLSDMLQAHHQKRDKRVQKRSTDSVSQALEALKDQLKFKARTDDSSKATLFFKLFEQTSYYALDEKYMRETIDKAEDYLVDLLREVIDGWSGHFVKLYMPSSYFKMVPSDLGMPVMMTHRRPIILSLKVNNAKLAMTSHPKTPIPVGFNFTAMIQPRIIHSSLTYMFTVTPNKQAFGTHLEKSVQVNLPLEISLGWVRPKSLWTFSLTPEAPKEVLHLKSEAKTFISKSKIAAAPSRDWLEDWKLIKRQAVPFKHVQKFGQKQFGIGFHVQLISENLWHEKPFWQSETAKKHGLAYALIEELKNPGLANREVHVNLQPDAEYPTYGIDTTFKYKWISDEETGSDLDDSDESSASNESDSDDSDESSSSQSSESSESLSKSDRSSDRKESLNRSRRSSGSASKKSSSSSGSSSSSSSVDEDESSDETSESSDSITSNSSGSRKSSKNRSSKKRSSSSRSRSSSSSSSESDSSVSMEDKVFDYEDVLALITGKSVEVHNIKRIGDILMKKTSDIWKQVYYKDRSGRSQALRKDEKTKTPMISTHNVEMTTVLRGPRPTYFASNFMYISTFDQRIQWVKADGFIKSPVGVYREIPTLFCAESVVAYPAQPGEFYYDQTTMETEKAKLQARLGWGEQCHRDGRVQVTGVMEKTEDKVNPPEEFALERNLQANNLKNWYYHQCEVDRAAGKSASHACQRAIIKESFFNQIVLDIKYKHVPHEVKNWTLRLDQYLKHHFWNHMENNNLNAENEDNKIRVIAHYSGKIPDVPLWNVRIEKPKETTQYTKIYTPYVRPPSTLIDTKDMLMTLINGYDSTPYCAVMEQAIKTFDNVTFDLPENNCRYLVAMDCSHKEKWAIFAQEVEREANTKNVYIMIDGREINLMPPQQDDLMQIQVDGKQHELTTESPLTFVGGNKDQTVKVWLRKTESMAVNPIAVIHAHHHGLKALYDGKNIKIILNDKEVTGKTCGICGNYDAETDNEFESPDQCIFEKSDDFFHSYSMGGTSCEKPSKPSGLVRCPKINRSPAQIAAREEKRIHEINRETQVSSEDDRRQLPEMAVYSGLRTSGLRTAQPSRQQQVRCQRLANKVIEKDDLICFSRRPVPQCGSICAPVEQKQATLEFHCLDKESSFTKQLVRESQNKILKMLSNKRVDLRETVTVDTRCA